MRARRAGRARPDRQRSPLFLIGAGVIVALGIVAVILTRGGTDREVPAQYRPVTVQGAALAPFAGAGADPAVGVRAPALAGQDFAGRTVRIEPDGRAKALVFLAHWCPHCRAEAPRLARYLAEVGLPDGVDLYVIPTGTSRARENYPPSAWLTRERLGTVPTLIDDEDGSAAAAYGLTSYPYLVLLDSRFQVAGRLSGAGIDFAGLLDRLAAGAG